MEKSTTRSSLSEAVFKNVGLSRNESANLVDSVFNEILSSLIQGDDVKISSFGTFNQFINSATTASTTAPHVCCFC